ECFEQDAEPDTDPDYRYCGCGRQVWGLKEGGKCHECCDRDTAEPQRVTLPGTPWTTVRVTLDDGDEQVWYTIDETGVWYDDYQDVTYSEMRARVVSYEVLAEPPKATPAETDAPKVYRWEDTKRLKHAMDGAAKRGRDEALAVVVNALRTFNVDSPDLVQECEIAQLAVDIERERGGDDE